MTRTATVRDLRNRFPAVKKLVEEEGEVIVTDNGTPKYKLILYRSKQHPQLPSATDYMERLKRYQPKPISARLARWIEEHNRGGR